MWKYAEVKVDSSCPLAERSDGGRFREITWSRRDDGVVEEFVTPGEPGIGEEERTVLDRTDGTVYRTSWKGTCPCLTVEEAGYLISSVRVVDGSLLLGVRCRQTEIAELVSTLRDVYDRVTLRRVGPIDGTDACERVVVNLSRLTDRQRDVLRTAVEMGYFEYPRGATMTEIADELGINDSTLSQHLVAAQSKILTHILS